jgi:hypothetical protein
MKVAILAAIIAGTVTSAQGFTTLCRSYSDGVFSFIECADGTYIVIGPGGGREESSAPYAWVLLGRVAIELHVLSPRAPENDL